MLAISFAMCVLLSTLGLFILDWRRWARSSGGFHLKTDVPPIVRSPRGNALIWLLGSLLIAGPFYYAVLVYSWIWALLMIFLVGGFERVLFALFLKKNASHLNFE